jgi:hypothetical protein
MSHIFVTYGSRMQHVCYTHFSCELTYMLNYKLHISFIYFPHIVHACSLYATHIFHVSEHVCCLYVSHVFHIFITYGSYVHPIFRTYFSCKRTHMFTICVICVWHMFHMSYLHDSYAFAYMGHIWHI